MSDDDIIERGGAQEDIDAYAHDVGGACGAVYDGSCDYCGKVTPTEQDKELREQLTELLTSMNRYHHTEPDDRLVDFITAYTNKQIEAVLDRLEATKTIYKARSYNDKGVMRTMTVTTAIPLDAIEAERIKLQAGGDWQGIAILTAMKLKESK